MRTFLRHRTRARPARVQGLQRLTRRAPLLLLALAGVACRAPSSHRAALAATPSAEVAAVAPAPAATYEWPGAWQLVGHDFPEGSRWATFLVERLASGELTGRFTMQGPPGSLESLQARGDSLHVRWLVSDGGGAGTLLEVHLAAVGDSVTGHWAMQGAGSGPVEGRRLRE